MKSTKPRTDKPDSPDTAQDPRSPDSSSAGVTGGAPASEEDIGTEGAGTEPRDSTGGATGAPSRDQGSKKGAA
jgi:hypothetical protein